MIHNFTEKRHLARLTSIVCILLLNLTGVCAAANPVLRLNDTNEPPLTTPQHDGFLDIISTEAFSRAGATLQLIKLPAERGLLNANAGIEDGDLTRIEGLEKLYPNLVRVPEKLINWEFVAFAKTANIPASWDNIRKHVTGHITGWKIYEQQLRGAKQIVAATNPTQLFTLLDRNRIEIALYARWMGQAYVERLGLKDIKQLEPVLASREMYIYLNKKHTSFVPRIANALRTIKREGLYNRLLLEKLTPPKLQTTR